MEISREYSRGCGPKVSIFNSPYENIPSYSMVNAMVF